MKTLISAFALGSMLACSTAALAAKAPGRSGLNKPSKRSIKAGRFPRSSGKKGWYQQYTYGDNWNHVARVNANNYLNIFTIGGNGTYQNK